MYTISCAAVLKLKNLYEIHLILGEKITNGLQTIITCKLETKKNIFKS